MCAPAPTRVSTDRGSGALADYFGAQIDQIEAGDTALRLGEREDTIHDTRVAIRRLRSTLRVFAKMLDASQVGDMDGELKWFTGLLGDVRDCQVQLNRFSEALEDLPDELILGPVKSRIRNHLQGIELSARIRVTEAMGSARYRDLMAVLRRWRAEPPLRGATSALRKRVRRAGRKADRRLSAALESGDAAMLHRARKAAKRARYAAELYRPLDKPKRAKRTIKHYKRIQSVLGDHQDCAVASAELWRMGTTAGSTLGENGFTFGVLYAREQQIAHESRHEARRLRN
jgi:CHAD domain-containing protein